ncbi:nucleoside triphosphate pyrophosphohydrolase [bacterium]|nr:nucleoside triphosphate pyrophosphohydrolase [bacterium]
MAKTKQTQKLLEIVARLRKECPWDRKQTNRSLVPYLLEEAYETLEAIRARDAKALREELGDLLLQVVLHCEIASETMGFDFEDVARGIGEKMVRRHPHVFAEGKVALGKHSQQWTELKQKEKPRKSLLQGTPQSMPALQLAQRYGEISSSVGFDWDDADGAWDKLHEELEELRKEFKARKRNRKRVADELGDVAFCLANLARHLGINAELAGRDASVKFSKRFAKMEAKARKSGARLAEWSPEEWDQAWRQAKT